jgi:hypothetical protein
MFSQMNWKLEPTRRDTRVITLVMLVTIRLGKSQRSLEWKRPKSIPVDRGAFDGDHDHELEAPHRKLLHLAFPLEYAVCYERNRQDIRTVDGCKGREHETKERGEVYLSESTK